jgi:TolB-like protein
MKTKILLIKSLVLILIIGIAPQESYAQERLAVFDFNVTSGMTNETAITLTNRFRNGMIQTEVYTLVERSAIEQVLAEQRFSVSDIANPETAIQLGDLLSADKIIVGDIGKVGQTYSITVRLIDAQTGSIEKSEALEYRGPQDGLLPELDVLAQKLAGTFVKKKKRGWLYITAAALLGGTAYVLTQESGGSTGLPLPPSPPNN